MTITRGSAWSFRKRPIARALNCCFSDSSKGDIPLPMDSDKGRPVQPFEFELEI